MKILLNFAHLDGNLTHTKWTKEEVRRTLCPNSILHTNTVKYVLLQFFRWYTSTQVFETSNFEKAKWFFKDFILLFLGGVQSLRFVCALHCGQYCTSTARSEIKHFFCILNVVCGVEMGHSYTQFVLVYVHYDREIEVLKEYLHGNQS